MQLYFGKSYKQDDKAAYEAFKRKSYTVNMQYASYLSIMYTYIRVPGLIDSVDNINFVFDQLFNFKQEDAWTWYHHACWKALQKDKTAAIESLAKSMKLGFGDYFMLMHDNDLEIIRSMPEFAAMMKKYFPDK